MATNESTIKKLNSKNDQPYFQKYREICGLLVVVLRHRSKTPTHAISFLPDSYLNILPY